MEKSKFVIWPQSSIYWVMAQRSCGERRKIEAFREETAAVKRLRELQKREDAINARIASRESSRWNSRQASSWNNQQTRSK